MEIRPIEEADVPDLLSVDRLCRQREVDDPDFGRLTVVEDELREAELLEFISRRNSPKHGTYDTRTFVVTEEGRVVGGFAYEMPPTSYEVVHLIGPDVVVSASLVFMLERAEESKKRKRVSFEVADWDTRLRVLVPAAQALGFDVTMARGGEAWLCVKDMD